MNKRQTRSAKKAAVKAAATSTNKASTKAGRTGSAQSRVKQTSLGSSNPHAKTNKSSSDSKSTQGKSAAKPISTLEETSTNIPSSTNIAGEQQAATPVTNMSIGNVADMSAGDVNTKVMNTNDKQLDQQTGGQHATEDEDGVVSGQSEEEDGEEAQRTTADKDVQNDVQTPHGRGLAGNDMHDSLVDGRDTTASNEE